MNGHKRLVDIAAIARERRQEAPKHIVERHVMIAGHAEHFMARLAQPLEELARLLELLGSGALGEVAADDDEVGLELVDAPLDGVDQSLVVGAEMEIGQVNEASHAPRTRRERCGSAQFVAVSRLRNS